jgi:hypothetical protein
MRKGSIQLINLKRNIDFLQADEGVSQQRAADRWMSGILTLCMNAVLFWNWCGVSMSGGAQGLITLGNSGGIPFM